MAALQHYVTAAETFVNTFGRVQCNALKELKTHQMFSVHTATEESKIETSSDHFGFVCEENSVREIA